ncbi:MAG TPA: hypothetical protein VKT70_09555 [Stellaceae bacterium]|nr:hypothetical protein [Stellaceae bacterium]
MKTATFFAFIVLAACFGARGASAACDPVGNTGFICGTFNSEDLVQVAGTPWIIASGLAEPVGHLYLIDARSHEVTVLIPGTEVAFHQDKASYGACPGAPDQKTFSAHGLNIRREADGTDTLYVVHHGGRESIEIFTLDARHGQPKLTWVGCVVYPPNTSPNAVAPLPGKGFAATSLFNPNDPKFADKLFAKEPMGNSFTWHPHKGWELIAGAADISGDNGIETSRDGKWVFIAGWGDETLVRLSLDPKHPSRDVIKTGFHTDNLRWGPDGVLYAAGQADTAQNIFGCFASKSEICTNPFTVLKVDPQSLAHEAVIEDKGSLAFGGGTTGLKVGHEFWVGTFRGDKIAILAGH